MLLGFPKAFPRRGKPTRFKEKVKDGIKIHAIKEDRCNSWRVGDTAHLCYGARSGKPHRWAKVDIKSIQVIKIEYADGARTPEIKIDGRRLGVMEVLLLAANEGFDTFDEFLDFFNMSMEYKLLHWTDFTYDGDMQRLDTMQRKVRDNVVQSTLTELGKHPITQTWSLDEKLPAESAEFIKNMLQSMGWVPAPKNPTFPEGGVHFNRGSEEFYIAERGHGHGKIDQREHVIVPPSKPRAHTMTVAPELYEQLKKHELEHLPFLQVDERPDLHKSLSAFVACVEEIFPSFKAGHGPAVYELPPLGWGDTKEPVLNDSPGCEEGAVCSREGCVARIAIKPTDNCSCHIDPPCSGCVNAPLWCPGCLWQSDEEPMLSAVDEEILNTLLKTPTGDLLLHYSINTIVGLRESGYIERFQNGYCITAAGRRVIALFNNEQPESQPEPLRELKVEWKGYCGTDHVKPEGGA